MKFIRDILSRRSSNQAAKQELAERHAEAQPLPSLSEAVDDLKRAVTEPEAPAEPEPRAAEAPGQSPDADDIMAKVNAQVSADEAVEKKPVNIWDIDATTPDPAPASTVAAPKSETPAAPVSPASANPRRRRNKTRLLGFDSASSDVVGLFDNAPKSTPAKRSKFVVGMIMVKDGPGRGECFPIEAGMSQIGRGEDQAVQLDFGDSAISRVNHAAIVYDTATHAYMLGHGGKKNVVRLNGTPVISNETLKTGDEIKIGETTLRFVAFCDADFNWTKSGDGEDEDVAIA